MLKVKRGQPEPPRYPIVGERIPEIDLIPVDPANLTASLPPTKPKLRPPTAVAKPKLKKPEKPAGTREVIREPTKPSTPVVAPNTHMSLRAQAGKAAPRITLQNLLFENFTPGVPGRKSQISKDVIDTICDAVAKGMPDSHAAAVAGIRPNALSDWVKASQTAKPGTLLAYLAYNFELARVYREQFYLGRIAESTDWRAAAWMLERTNPRTWGKQAVEQEAKKEEPQEALAKLIGAMDKTAATILKQQESIENGPQVFVVTEPGPDTEEGLADADANQDDQERRRIGFRSYEQEAEEDE